jgi:NAD(P)-dependent dehydrogenase (short-subunit alcohol dehydrogenase family)
MDTENKSFVDKVIVIIGGASGVGKAVALEITKRGGQVVIADRKVQEFSDTLEWKAVGGNQPCFLEFDLCDIEQCKSIFDEASSNYGKIDGCFCYAGVTHANDLLQCDEAHFDEIFDTNFKGVFFCCKYAVEHMKETGGGSIVLTGSPHAWGGDLDRVAYACSKGALFPLMKNIAQHYAQYGIRANLITMGWTPTEGELSLRESQNMSVEELHDLASSVIPAGKMTEVSDLTPGVIYFLSDDSKMVSGSNLRVTGGWYL